MWTIEPLAARHRREDFACGREALDRWLSQVALQHQRRGLSRTFVAVEAAEPARIAGFHALTVCEVQAVELPADLAKRLPRKIPGVRLGRLAVALAWQGRGLGEQLLVHAIGNAKRITEHAGVNALFVDAKDDTAAAFYRHFGFRAFPDNRLQLVLPLATVG